MSQKSRVDRLEQTARLGRESVDDGPPIIVYWPEDETRETRLAAAEARRWYLSRGLSLPTDVEVTWEDGTPVTPP